MSASTRTIQQPLGIRQMAVLLMAVALALVVAAAVAFGQLTVSKVQTAPAVGAPPAFIDHGSRSEIGTSGTLRWGPAPGSFVDKETRDSGSGTSGGSIRNRGQ
jgi:hypothetical protein